MKSLQVVKIPAILENQEISEKREILRIAENLQLEWDALLASGNPNLLPLIAADGHKLAEYIRKTLKQAA